MSLADNLKDLGNMPSGYSPNARKFLDELYAGQVNPPKTEHERIELLRSLIGPGFIPGHFQTRELERKAYEYFFLNKMGLTR